MARRKKDQEDAPKKKARRRQRKARNDSISSDDSDSSSSSDSSHEPQEVKAQEKLTSQRATESPSTLEELPASEPKQKAFDEGAFSDWYLRQVTKEFGEDLEKIRTASDFKESSLPILITALKQGEALFSLEEKKTILGSK